MSDILSELKKVEDELNRRRKEEALRYYNTGDKIHKKQMDFHKSTIRNRWLFGGNRTGKTVGGAVEAVWYARGNHPYKQITKPVRGWVVSLSNEVQRDVAQKEVLRWLNPAWIKEVFVRQGKKEDPDNAIIDYILVESIHGGTSTIGFKNCEQGRAKFQGTSQDFIWFDEEPPEEIYQECRMRVMDTKGDIWGTMTPLLGLTWAYNVIYINERNDPQVKYWAMEWADNPFLSPEEVFGLEATMTEEEKEARQHGRFVAKSGLVYKEFNSEIHVIEPFEIPRDWYDNMSIDPGLDNPLSCHWYACNGDGDVYVIAEHYKAGLNIKQHSSEIITMCEYLKWPIKSNGKYESLIDSAANQITLAAEKSVTQLFNEHGIMVNTHIDKDKYTGIQRVKLFLELRSQEDTEAWPKGKPKLFIFNTCPELIKEIKKYRYKPGCDEPVKTDDHALDELRYYIMSRPKPYRAPAKELTVIQKHKSKVEMRLTRRR